MRRTTSSQDTVDSGGSRLCAPVFSHLLGILFRVSRPWYPSCRCAWRRLLEHPVDLFESESLCLRFEEVGVDKGTRAEGALYKIRPISQRRHKTREWKSYSNEGDRRAEVTLSLVDHIGSNTTGTDGEWEKLACV